jgi:hypothetical protein
MLAGSSRLILSILSVFVFLSSESIRIVLADDVNDPVCIKTPNLHDEIVIAEKSRGVTPRQAAEHLLAGPKVPATIKKTITHYLKNYCAYNTPNIWMPDKNWALKSACLCTSLGMGKAMLDVIGGESIASDQLNMRGGGADACSNQVLGRGSIQKNRPENTAFFRGKKLSDIVPKAKDVQTIKRSKLKDLRANLRPGSLVHLECACNHKSDKCYSRGADDAHHWIMYMGEGPDGSPLFADDISIFQGACETSCRKKTNGDYVEHGSCSRLTKCLEKCWSVNRKNRTGCYPENPIGCGYSAETLEPHIGQDWPATQKSCKPGAIPCIHDVLDPVQLLPER